jgi:peptidoglycan/LPS O-acetylase OafA/YrhL
MDRSASSSYTAEPASRENHGRRGAVRNQKQDAPMSTEVRRAEIDGLRGFAILLVVLFHYGARWPDLYPYQDSYANNFIVRHGFLGVELFFMISGYVIFMTLDNSRSLLQFLHKRWARLFPAMAIATMLILASAPLFPERPRGMPQLSDALPGLAFIDPYWLSILFKTRFNDIEASFWSLYVEVRFYILFGCLYFYIGRGKSIAILAAIAAAYISLDLIHARLAPGSSLVANLSYVVGDALVGKFLPWFLIGMLAYLKQGSANGMRINAAIALISIPALMLIRHGPLAAAIGAALIFLFLAVAWGSRLKWIFLGRGLGFFGMLSYPLYLIHENAGVSIIAQAGRLSWLPSIALPFLALACTAFPAFLIARHIEPALQKKLRPKLRNTAAPAVTGADSAGIRK